MREEVNNYISWQYFLYDFVMISYLMYQNNKKFKKSCTQCGLHFCNHDPIGCLKYTLNQPKIGLHAINIRANKNTSTSLQAKRNDLQLELIGLLGMEVSPLIGGSTSDQVSPPIRGPTFDWRSHFQSEVPPLEVSPLIRDLTSNWRSHLWLEVSPPGGIFYTIWGDHNTWLHQEQEQWEQQEKWHRRIGIAQLC